MSVELSKMSDDFRIKASQLIQTICFKEIIRQISNSCIERGMLMDRIWNSNITLFTVAEEVQHKECIGIKQEFDKGIVEAERSFKEELQKVREKVKECIKTVADKDMEILQKDSRITFLHEDIDELKAKNKSKDDEIDRIVEHFNRTGKLPLEYMNERNAHEKKEEEERIAFEKLKNEEAEQKRKQEEIAKETERLKILGVMGGAGGPQMAKRKMMIPPKRVEDMNPSELKCKDMTLLELIAIYANLNEDEQMRQAALRTMIEK